MKKIEPPKAIEIEQAVLGAILQNNNVIDDSLLLISANSFFDKRHSLIYSTMLKMYAAGIPIDLITLYEEIKKAGHSQSIGADYISKLSVSVSSAANAVYHCKIVKEKQVQRELITHSSKIIQDVMSGLEDTFEIHSKAIESLENILDEVEESRSDKSLYEDLDETLAGIETAIIKQEDTGLIARSFPTFNRITGGINDTDFIVIYGFEKQGKTTFALQLALDIAIDAQKPVGIFSLEMDKITVYKKSFSLRVGVDYRKLRSPKQNRLSLDELGQLKKEIHHEFAGTGIYVIDKVIDKNKIKAKMKMLKKNKGAKLFIIDYISLIPSYEKYERRDLEIASLSRFFKLAAKEMNTPIIMLSQSNAEGKVAESKALSRDADFVFSIKKPLEQGIRRIKINNHDITVNEDHFLVNLEYSRHGKNYYQFLCGYTSRNLFKEVDLLYASIDSEKYRTEDVF